MRDEQLTKSIMLALTSALVQGAEGEIGRVLRGPRNRPYMVVSTAIPLDDAVEALITELDNEGLCIGPKVAQPKCVTPR